MLSNHPMQSVNLTDEELKRLYFSIKTNKIYNRKDMSADEITAILKLANDKFNKITNNTDSSVNIHFHRSDAAASLGKYYEPDSFSTVPTFYFSNSQTNLAVSVVLSKNKNPKCVMNFDIQIPKIVDNEIELKTLPSTLSKAVRGKNKYANLQSACLIEAITEVLKVPVTGVGFSRTCQNLRIASLINPNNIENAIFIAGLGPTNKQIEQALEFRKHFNSQGKSDQQLNEELRQKTFSISSARTDHVVDHAPLVGFENLNEATGKRLAVRTTGIAHATIIPCLERFLEERIPYNDKLDREESKHCVFKREVIRDKGKNRRLNPIKSSIFDRPVIKSA